MNITKCRWSTSLAAAREFLEGFFNEYNHVHRFLGDDGVLHDVA